MINAGQEFKKGFAHLLETFGGQVIVHTDFNCDDTKNFEVKGMKNHEKGKPSIVMFQFPEKLDVKTGMVIQQKGSSDYWKVYKTQEKIVSDVFVYFSLYVHRIDVNGNPLD